MRPRLWFAPFQACVHSRASPLCLGREKLEDLQMFGQSEGAGGLARGQVDGEAGGWPIVLWGSAGRPPTTTASSPTSAALGSPRELQQHPEEKGRRFFCLLDGAGSVLPANNGHKRYSKRVKISGCR